MDSIRRSIQGLTDKVRTFFTNGENQEHSEDSGQSGHSGDSSEILECSSDCSFCASENRSISMHPSVTSSKQSIEAGKEIGDGSKLRISCHSNRSVKRLKIDSPEEEKKRREDEMEIVDLSFNNKLIIMPEEGGQPSSSSDSNKAVASVSDLDKDNDLKELGEVKTV